MNEKEKEEFERVIQRDREMYAALKARIGEDPAMLISETANLYNIGMMMSAELGDKFELAWSHAGAEMCKCIASVYKMDANDVGQSMVMLEKFEGSNSRTNMSEERRGCGYRKKGGIYLMGERGGIPCCALPVELTICPCCGAGIKQARGWTWIDPRLLFASHRCSAEPARQAICPIANPESLNGKLGLIWIGERFYPTVEEFLHEASRMGISRRISTIPREFKLGETWVALAHPKTIKRPKVAKQDAPLVGGLEAAWEYFPGIFRIFRPHAIEKVVGQAEYDAAQRAGMEGGAALDSELWKQYEADKRRRITWAPVPDNDPRHEGSVYAKNQEEFEV